MLLVCCFVSAARAQWTPVSSGTTKALRGIYLRDSGVAYAVGDAGTILKSTDAGLSWSALTSGTTRNLYDLYFFNDNEGLTIGDSGLILRTLDGGATWSTIASGVKDGLRAISFSGANGICGGLSQDILYSNDSGATWHVSQKGFFGGGFFGAHMLSSTLGFVSGQNSIFQPLHGTSTDGGVHWDFHPFYFDGNEGSCDDLFFFDSSTGVTSGVLFDGRGAIGRTSDGGLTWTSTIFDFGLQGVDFPTPSSGFVVGFAGTIMHSSDMGVTWSPQTSGTGVDLFDVRFQSNAMAGLAVGEAGIVLRTTNGGEEGGLELLAAVSRKRGFDIELPLTGSSGVECRGGKDGYYRLGFVFNNSITTVDQITTSCGAISSSRSVVSDPHALRVDLTAPDCNENFVTITLSGIHDDQGNTLPNAVVTMGLLLGDVNGDGIVDETDVAQVENDQGAVTDESNFREDINLNGQIDAGDLRIVEGQVGSMLPP